MSPPASRAVGAPLRIASLAKQVPLAESLRLESGRLVRRGVGFEMNPYCRRAVSEGVALARASGGSCRVVTLGPESAEDVLREAVAWGAEAGLHVCDPRLRRLRHAGDGPHPGGGAGRGGTFRPRARRPQFD